MTSFLPRDFVLPSVSVLEVMADLQPCRFESERVPNAKDRESENEEANDRLVGTFWCACERCETIPSKENVFVAEMSQGQKTKNYGRNNFNLILHWSQSMEKQSSL